MYCIIYYVIVNFALVTRGLGDSESSRTVNGNSTIILKHPHTVSIKLNGIHHCGGSLVKPNIVLTAAHCLTDGTDDPSVFIVRVGTRFRDYGGQTRKVIEICLHTKYNPYAHGLTADYDVGVAKLQIPVVLHSYVKLIKLQPKGVEVPDNSIGTVAGWGLLMEKHNNSRSTIILQELKVYKLNQEVCKVTSILIVSDRFTCFGSEMGLKSFCRGDSGSALLVDGKQVGIVSSTMGCGLPLFFQNLYTRVENEEIRDHIDQCISKFEK